MNSKLLIICSFLVLVGCGVKSTPIAPLNADVPSLLENYPDIEPDKPLLDAKTP